MKRASIAALTLSAAGMAGLFVHEEFVGKAMIPVAGDPYTYGFGSTTKPDGTPVKEGDTVTPVQAVRVAVSHIAKDEAKLAKCVTAPINQKEYDLLVGHAYQYGVHKTCASTLVKKTNAGDYVGACHEYARWNVVRGKDCSARDSGCYGVHTRALERRDQCLAAQPIEEVAPKEVASKVIESNEKPTSNIAWILLALSLISFIVWQNREKVKLAFKRIVEKVRN
jgi:lysozyme